MTKKYIEDAEERAIENGDEPASKMTKLELFSVIIMAGRVSSDQPDYEADPESHARMSVSLARALLKELEES